MEFGRRGVRGLTAVPGVSRALRDARGPATIQLRSMEAHLASANRHSGFHAPCSAQVCLLLVTRAQSHLSQPISQNLHLRQTRETQVGA